MEDAEFEEIQLEDSEDRTSLNSTPSQSTNSENEVHTA